MWPLGLLRGNNNSKVGPFIKKKIKVLKMNTLNLSRKSALSEVITAHIINHLND